MIWLCFHMVQGCAATALRSTIRVTSRALLPCCVLWIGRYFSSAERDRSATLPLCIFSRMLEKMKGCRRLRANHKRPDRYRSGRRWTIARLPLGAVSTVPCAPCFPERDFSVPEPRPLICLCSKVVAKGLSRSCHLQIVLLIHFGASLCSPSHNLLCLASLVAASYSRAAAKKVA